PRGARGRGPEAGAPGDPPAPRRPGLAVAWTGEEPLARLRTSPGRLRHRRAGRAGAGGRRRAALGVRPSESPGRHWMATAAGYRGWDARHEGRALTGDDHENASSS